MRERSAQARRRRDQHEQGCADQLVCDVTRTIARRGTALRLPGVDPSAALQHFAVVLDGRLISVASIDPQQLPDGIDGENGAVIEGGFTIRSAQDLARQIKDER